MRNREFYPLDTSGDEFPTSVEKFQAQMDADIARTDAAQASVPQFAFKIIKGKRPRKRRREKIYHPGAVIGGRPYTLAYIPAMVHLGDDWVFQDVIWRCQGILSKLTYQQSQAICHAFGWAYSTYKARCSMYRPPHLWEALLIVDWAMRGKPIVRKRQKCNISWDEYREKIEQRRKELAEQRQRGWGQV